MMKKVYTAPKMVIRHIFIEGIMQVQSVEIDGTGSPHEDGEWGLEDADSKSIGDKSFDIWED